jgi:hypothetical protein
MLVIENSIGVGSMNCNKLIFKGDHSFKTHPISTPTRKCQNKRLMLKLLPLKLPRKLRRKRRPRRQKVKKLHVRRRRTID